MSNIDTLTGNPPPTTIDFNNPPSNPLLLLQAWLKKADELNISEPRSLVLATVDQHNRPSTRVILLKECTDTGVIFGTSQASRKGQELESNPSAAGNLWWRETIQQINFQGRVVKLPADVSDAAFQARPRDGQALSYFSQQSDIMRDEASLKKQVQQLMNSADKIARPERWHAYHLIIESIEFWQGSQDRFHKRLRYDLLNGAWQHQTLQP